MSTTAIILAQFKVAKAIYPHGLQVLLASTGSRTRLTDSHSTTSPNFKVHCCIIHHPASNRHINRSIYLRAAPTSAD